jgi:beta-galactosidase
MLRTDLQLPFGAVYFRKSNPPREDWERDYRVAAEDGLNVFRHWFMWGAIERAPGVFDWADYDRQMDLAAANGIKTIIAELIHAIPDWALRAFDHARQVRADGRRLASHMGVSPAVGGFANNGGGAGALSLDCPEVKEAAGRFLGALAERYKGHPALYGYDVWNECNYAADVDYSPYAKATFRQWVRRKYGTLEAVATAWHRYSYADWDDIEPPTQMAPYPECLDWQQFRRDNFFAQMQWRIDTIRAVDPSVMIVAHGLAGVVPFFTANGCDDWLAASKVEAYGYTWIQARKGSEPWKSFYATDIVRAAARGKPYWHAERQGGPLWLQPQVIGRDKEDGRVTDPEDIRIWTMISFAGGARGVMNLRFRPLLDGPLFGAFGSYGMDGSRTPRSEMQSRLAKWANAPAQSAMWQARPVRGEIGILVAPDAQDFDYLLNFDRAEKPGPAALWGAYRGFLENGVQPDWVHLDDIGAYDLLYFPNPVLLTAGQAAGLAHWVEAGGTLIAEACPGYFGARGHVEVRQPGGGLDAVFGAVEESVEFMPDIADRIRFDFRGQAVEGGGFLQAYRPAGGTPLGSFSDGRFAVVEHTFGKGRTLLVGTSPGAGYYRAASAANRRFFADVFHWSGREKHVTLSAVGLFARLHAGDHGTFLWLVNPTRKALTTTVELGNAHRGKRPAACLWPEGGAVPTNSVIEVGARDVVILHLA